MTGHCTKLWCVILTFNASDTDRPSVGRCRLVSSEICVQVTWHAESFLKPQDTGFRSHLCNLLFYLGISHCKLRERGGACPGRCSNVSQPRSMSVTHHLTSLECRTVAVRNLALKCLIHLFLKAPSTDKHNYHSKSKLVHLIDEVADICHYLPVICNGYHTPVRGSKCY
jgi:hypothetical protein